MLDPSSRWFVAAQLAQARTVRPSSWFEAVEFMRDTWANITAREVADGNTCPRAAVVWEAFDSIYQRANTYRMKTR